jgi:hypothetical protein
MNYRSITIPAAANGAPGTYSERVSASVFACISSTSGFRIQPGTQSSVSMSAGRTFGSANGIKFNRITFLNDSASTVDVTYYVGLEDFRPDPSSVSSTGVLSAIKDSATYAKAYANTSIGGGQQVVFNGLDGSNVRKQISVSNGDASDVLHIKDSSGKVGAFIQPGQTWTHITSADLRVYNPNVGSMSFAVLETFYS